MRAVWITLLASTGLASTGPAFPASAQDRSNDNAVTQAEDAFGFSVGRESLGIYGAGNARGFSPTAAGNVRIEGLYFDPAFSLSSIVASSTSIRVGLSAQGYPLVAPSGIVDVSLRRPQTRSAASFVLNTDSFGSYGVEVDGSLPVTGRLSIGYGVTGNRVAFPDGTDNFNHGQGVIARWRPAPGIEVMPFWTLNNDYDDEAGQFYVPAGKFLPPQPPRHRFDGPGWADIRYAATNHGALASVAPARNWLLRLGAFRSVYDQKTGYTNLLLGVRPDGGGDRLVIADPRLKNVSLSGEARLTHSVADGPRLHLVHFSLRERDARRQYGGSDQVDLGPTRIGVADLSAKPAFAFGPIARDHVRQATYSVAYDGRWKDVGEIGLGVSRVDYDKTTLLPGSRRSSRGRGPGSTTAPSRCRRRARSASMPAMRAAWRRAASRPPTAVNRNQPLPAILTEQKDAGLRWNVTGTIKAVVGAFDLRKPYFGFDAAGLYTQVGTTRSRGAEFSVSGNLTGRLNMVAGGYVLRPRVERDAGVPGAIGSRPVGLSDHLFNLNLNWRTPMLDGLALDAAVFARGKTPATTDNLVTVPPREQINLGGRYRFKLAALPATLRFQVQNLLDDRGFNVAGPGVYGQNSGRFLTAYLAIDA